MLKIAGIEIPYESGLSIAQTLSYLPTRFVRRMHNGAAHVQEHFKKLETTINASGWVPDMLAAVDFGEPFYIDCIKRLSVGSTANAIVIGHAFRSDGDYAPEGAIVIGGELRPAAVTIIGSTVTVAEDAEADAYAVIYYPRLLCISEAGIQRGDDLEGNYSWSLTAEEV